MNIIIRRMKSSDADALYRLLSDPEVMRYLEPLYDRAQTEAFLHRAGLSEPPLVYAAEGNGRFIGYVIYHPYDEESVLGARVRVSADGSAHLQSKTGA